MSRRQSCTKIAKTIIEHRERFIGVIAPAAEDYLAESNETGLAEYLRSQCEAYGPDVRCYLQSALGRRRTLEKELRRIGLAPNRDYWPDHNSITEFPVSYFKAWHWDV